MKTIEPESDLSLLLADLNEDEVLKQVTLRLNKGEDPLVVAEECQKGVRLVGERYEKGIYYLSGLIMAGEILNQIGELLFPLLKTRITGNESGRILLGTVEGDIHYIGKDIASVLLQCFGFTVFDLGVDVPPNDFVIKAREIKPHIVGLSCLIHSSHKAMHDTVELLRSEKGISPSFIIGGLVDEQVRKYANAHAWADDAMAGVRLCQQLIRKHKE